MIGSGSKRDGEDRWTARFETSVVYERGTLDDRIEERPATFSQSGCVLQLKDKDFPLVHVN